MTEKRFRVHELVKDYYSEIGEYIDENHTDNPLKNDEVVELLNELHEENEQLKQQVAFLSEFIKSGVQYEYYQKVYDENEQLKNICKNLINEINKRGITVTMSDSYKELLE